MIVELTTAQYPVALIDWQEAATQLSTPFCLSSPGLCAHPAAFRFFPEEAYPEVSC